MKWLIKWLSELFKGKEKEPEPEEKPKPITQIPWSRSGRRRIMVKPFSQGEQKLVILLPASYHPDDIDRVTVGTERSYKIYKTTDPDKIVLNANGTKSGPNGNATHCRFQFPGPAYGTATLRVYMNDGQIVTRAFAMHTKKEYNFTPAPAQREVNL